MTFFRRFLFLGVSAFFVTACTSGGPVEAGGLASGEVVDGLGQADTCEDPETAIRCDTITEREPTPPADPDSPRRVECANGPSAPTSQIDEPAVSWTPSALKVRVRQGTSYFIDPTAEFLRDVPDAMILIEGDAAEFVVFQGQCGDPMDFSLGSELSLAGVVDVPLGIPVGSYDGTISFVSIEQGTERLPISVIVEDVSTAFPSEFAFPSSTRVGDIEPGLSAILDEMVVGLSLDESNPEKVISAIAQEYGAEVIGANPVLRSYQLRFRTLSTEEIEELASDLNLRPDVSYALLHYLNGTLAAASTDDPG